MKAAPFAVSASAVFAALYVATASAATVQGVVRDDAQHAVRGAIVTLTSADELFAETVYSDDHGRFRLSTQQHGALSLRVRYPYFADSNRAVKLDANGTVDVSIALAPLVGARAISESLSASAHFAHLRQQLPAGRERETMQLLCMGCHNLGSPFTRARRSDEQWAQIAKRMLGYQGIEDPAWAEKYAAALAKGFDGSVVAHRQTHTIDPMILPARITEWKLPGAVIAHDAEYREADGKFYTVDMGHDQIFITDPVANRTEVFALPDNGVPLGGKFFKVHGLSRIFGYSIRHGLHSLQVGPDDKIYTTNAIGGQIGVFDPDQRSFEGIDVGGNGMYPHTLRFDGKGFGWFTLGASNQVGRLELSSRKVTLIDLPKTTDFPEMPVTQTYGIDINPLDGSIWYSRMMANKIGRIDPKTLAVQEFDPPLRGPRRLRFSADGALWIPGFASGTLLKLDTRTMKFESYPLPTLAPDETEAPYALNVHPRTQEVWVTPLLSDRLFRFLPKQKRFIAYPLPTRGTYLRDFFILPDGRLCGSNSPVPPIPTVIEGGMQGLLCIDPQG